MAVHARRRPLRVLMSADAVGGVWTYALELARALGDFEVEVVLATLGPSPRPHQVSAADELPNLTLLSRELALEWMPTPWAEVDAAGEWLLALERELSPDLVHINGYAHAAQGFHAPVISVAHSCVCSWWRAVHGCDAPKPWNEYRRRVLAGLDAADALVAPTAAILAEILSCHDSGARGRVIHNGRRISPTLRRKQALILSVGRLWDEAKNLVALDRCAGELDWPVYVAGPLSRHADRNAEAGALHALGVQSQSQVVDWMARAAIYCLPARYEPFGLSVLEAAQAGCALVIGDIASLREVWGDAAVYVPPDDEEALADALRRLIADTDRRRVMVGRARRRASRYLPEAMAGRYRALYDELTRARPHPHPIERSLET